MKGSVVVDLEGLESICVSRDVSDLASAFGRRDNYQLIQFHSLWDFCESETTK